MKVPLRVLAAAVLAFGGLAASSLAQADDGQKILDAIRWAEHSAGNRCDFGSLKPRNKTTNNHYFEIRFRYPGQDQDSPDNVFPLYELLCAHTGPNEVRIYLTEDESSYRLLSFAEPKLDYDYTDESFSELKAPPRIIGYIATNQLTGSIFDPKAKTITMKTKWRQRGDAWSSGEWLFDDGQFVLKHYDVDPTYNRDNPDATKVDPEKHENYQIYPEVMLRNK